jgi:hypothetical protein
MITRTWQSGDGDWFNATNWDAGIPLPGGTGVGWPPHQAYATKTHKQSV